MSVRQGLFLFVAAMTLGGCDSAGQETEQAPHADVFEATTFVSANFFSGCLDTFDALAYGGYVNLKLYADSTFEMGWSAGSGHRSTEGSYAYTSARDTLLLSHTEGTGPFGGNPSA